MKPLSHASSLLVNRAAPIDSSCNGRFVDKPGRQTGAIRWVLAAVVLIAIFCDALDSRGAGVSSGGAIRGHVVDASGVAVPGAEVRLEMDGQVRARATSRARDGSFRFEGVAAGTYAVVAEEDGIRSSAVQVVVTDRGTQEDIAVVLGAGKSAGNTPNSGARAMEFADNPIFTIAGVTDWTAAGGHGSDVSLRTSEALNRETLGLKADEKAEGALSGDAEQEARLRKAVEAAPTSFDANRQLGSFYLREGRYREGEPLLQKAYEVDSSDAVNEADFAVALQGAGDLAGAREHVEHALSRADKAEIHRAAGSIYETSGDPLRAVHEFSLAFRLDPSEQNSFAWGEELLQHRAVLQAKEVFEQGVKLYPKSSRLLTSLGAALFAGAFYEQSAERLCEASDLDPRDVAPYQFMGKIEIVAPHFDSCMDARLARYVDLYPNDSLANYFYAMDLWKQQGTTLDAAMEQKVESLLTRTVTLDTKCSDGFLQLGNLKSSEKDYLAAIGLYAKAIGADPQSSEAHYRLGVAYDRIGEREKAKEEFAAHDAIAKQQAAETERERKEIKQFVVEAEKMPATPPTQ